MSIREKLEYTHEEGKSIGKDLTVFALSTCGFCKRALKFLRERGLAFKYIYVDYMQEFQKEELKRELRKEYKERPMYPFLLIGEKDFLVGFDEDEWKEKLGGPESGGSAEGEDDSSGDSRLTAGYKFVNMVAGHQGWRLNRDKEFLHNLVQGLTTNKERYGYYLCPCRLGEGDKEKDKDIVCPCEYSKPDIAEYGHCYCSLYQSPEFYFSGKNPASIPERRPEKI